MSSVEETMAYDAFEAVVRARDASDDASLASTTRSAADEEVANARLVESRRALARTGALADVSDAYALVGVRGATAALAEARLPCVGLGLGVGLGVE